MKPIYTLKIEDNNILDSQGRVIGVSSKDDGVYEISPEQVLHYTESETVRLYNPTYYSQSSSDISSIDEILETHNDIVHKTLQDDPFQEMEDGKKLWVLQNHFIGEGYTADFRFELGNELLGWTLLHQVPGELDDPVESMEKAKDLTGSFDDSKWNESVGDTKVAAVKKERHPRKWITREGVIPKGQPGASDNYSGYMVIWDRGTLEMGAQKSDFHEYFLKSRNGVIDGRIVFVNPQNDSEEGTDWLFWKPDKQIPYMLRQESSNSSWITPYRFSGLPNKVESMITDDQYKYWLYRSEENRREIHDKLISNLSKFGLQENDYELYSTEDGWILKVSYDGNEYKYEFDESLENQEEHKGEINGEITSKGEVVELEDNMIEVGDIGKWKVEDQNLKMVENKELSTGFKLLGDNIIEGTALTHGVWKGLYWHEDAIKEAADKLVGKPIDVEHNRDNKVGRIIDAQYINEELRIKARIEDDEILDDIRNGEYGSFSIDASIEPNPDRRVVEGISSWHSVTITETPACPLCNIEVA